jgi:hypothetical protein
MKKTYKLLRTTATIELLEGKLTFTIVDTKYPRDKATIVSLLHQIADEDYDQNDDVNTITKTESGFVMETPNQDVLKRSYDTFCMAMVLMGYPPL